MSGLVGPTPTTAVLSQTKRTISAHMVRSRQEIARQCSACHVGVACPTGHYSLQQRHSLARRHVRSFAAHLRRPCPTWIAVYHSASVSLWLHPARPAGQAGRTATHQAAARHPRWASQNRINNPKRRVYLPFQAVMAHERNIEESGQDRINN